MTEPATAEDRRWWLRLAPALHWTWAVTYEQTAPHWYVVLGRTKGMDRDDFIRVGRVVRTFGEAGRFYSMTNLYLFTEDRRLKFWCIWGDPVEDIHARVINLATTERTYGPQTNFDMRRVRQLRLPPP